MPNQLDQLESEALAALDAAKDADALEQFRVKYLGTKGAIKRAMAQLKEVPREEKPAYGKRANALRQAIEEAFKKRLSGQASQASSVSRAQADITVPGDPPRLGREHVITQTIDELIDVFGRMGFDVVSGPEVEDEYHNFIALNIPESHPARDPLDNFYLEPASGRPAEIDGTGTAELLRSQTSTVQIRVMQSTPPPIRVITTGRVYRPDEHDATHYSMFHQVEGLYVDRDVSMVDLKTTLFQFAHAMFGPEADIRLHPSYFPFTEPSAELEVRMQVQGKWQWIEVGGCGMVDPEVFRHVGYDPEQWTGFAFGLGIERLAMRKYKIEDIRWLFENDVRFLRQF